MRVAILHNAVAADAPAVERDVLDQVAAARDALEARGHHVCALPVDLDLAELKSSLARERPERVFNLVESLDGDDRGILQVPVLLESLGIPFTGAPLQAILMTTNKLVAKRLLRDAGLPTPDWFAPGDLAPGADALAGDRVIVKPVWDHGSAAVDEADVRTFESGTALRAALDPGSRKERFAERYVEGREFNLALLATGAGEVQLLPPAEMVFCGWTGDRPRVVGYRAKWVTDSFEYRNTRRRFDFDPSDEPLLADLMRMARATWRCFGLRGYGRVDFRVDERGAPTILEANVNPCLTPDAGFAAALERAGISYADAIERILADACAVRRIDEALPDMTTDEGSPSVHLRCEVKPEDVAMVEGIVRSTGAFRDDEIAVAVELVQENLARGAQASGYHFLFAESDATTVGYACFGPIACSLQGWDLYWIAVEQSQRRRGVGRLLMDAAERAVARAGGRRVYVETSSRPDYGATRSFYESRGYVAEARLADFYAPGDSKIVYVKRV
jgi:D-alanine-D-alanine ligase